MKKYMPMMLCAAMLSLCALADAVPVSTKLDDGVLAVTNQQTIARTGVPLEYIAIQNDATFSNTVTITATALDGAVSLGTLYTGTLTAGATTTAYPVRAFDDGETTNRSYVVSGVKIVVLSASGATNAVDGTVKALFQSQ